MKSRLTWAAACTLLLLSGGAEAQDPVFAGKQINLVIGSTSGGGQDTYGRIVARHLGRQIPGNPVIVPQNAPGAAGRTAVRALDVSPRKDGTHIVTFTPGIVIQSIVTPETTPLNFSNYAWIGSVGREPRICFAWAATGVTSWDDLLKRDQFVVGDTGGGGQTHLMARVLQQMFGVKIKLVLGYPGVSEKRLAIERGELDGDCGTLASLPPEWLRDRKIVPVLRLQDQAMAGVPDGVPYIGDLVKADARKKQLLELLNAATDLGRPFIVSKEVPTERIATLRAAFDKMARDPQFLAEAERQRLDVTPIAGTELQATIDELYRTSPEVVAAAREMTAK
jgi:tripartite-type tricarboxylate transporter receptor subunit TctC